MIRIYSGKSGNRRCKGVNADGETCLKVIVVNMGYHDSRGRSSNRHSREGSAKLSDSAMFKMRSWWLTLKQPLSTPEARSGRARNFLVIVSRTVDRILVTESNTYRKGDIAVV